MEKDILRRFFALQVPEGVQMISRDSQQPGQYSVDNSGGGGFSGGVTAAVAVTSSNRGLLMGKYALDGDRKDLWCFPGGTINKGEDPSEAAVRELMEETGVLAAYYEIIPREYSHLPSYLYILCEVLDDSDMECNSEYSELSWISPEEIGTSIPLEDIYEPNRAFFNANTDVYSMLTTPDMVTDSLSQGEIHSNDSWDLAEGGSTR